MRSLRLLATLALITALILSVQGRVFGQYYGVAGGQINGFVFGPNGFGYDWARIDANNGNQTFHAFSGMSGFYLMRVPAGVYNVSVYTPAVPLETSSANVTVTEGSTATVNFHLQLQPIVAVPEFQTNMSALVMAIALAISIGITNKKVNARTGTTVF